jgi:hypothetical protein
VKTITYSYFRNTHILYHVSYLSYLMNQRTYLTMSEASLRFLVKFVGLEFNNHMHGTIHTRILHSLGVNCIDCVAVIDNCLRNRLGVYLQLVCLRLYFYVLSNTRPCPRPYRNYKLLTAQIPKAIVKATPPKEKIRIGASPPSKVVPTRSPTFLA